MKKPIFYTELAYIFGLLILAVSTALTERADFGVSMVIAPAYLLHLKVSQFLPFFTFGMAEYTFQALLLVVAMLVLRKAKRFFTASRWTVQWRLSRLSPKQALPPILLCI